MKTNLANWAARYGLTLKDAKRLQDAANVAFKAEDQDKPLSEINATANAFEKIANSLGFTVIWPGLWPLLFKNGVEIHLPD